MMELNKDYTVHTENSVLWVNGPYNCLGRFTEKGYEIYRDMKAPVEVIGTTSTLAVRMHNTKPLDWSNFKTLMKEHHGIDLSEVDYPHA
jgi:hypothetical protein